LTTILDLWDLEDRLKNQDLKLDLILGHSKGSFISIDYGVPMVRVGFPVYDQGGNVPPSGDGLPGGYSSGRGYG
jgi:nitrogenase molybdenum-iron protein beta chain